MVGVLRFNADGMMHMYMFVVLKSGIPAPRQMDENNQTLTQLEED